jgi:L-ascorbate metabolism protein UlaG (beta-lactamase superfamily)
MRVEWYGQSAFRLTGGDVTVFVDPFGDLSSALPGSSIHFDYPPIAGVSADLLLITHEHIGGRLRARRRSRDRAGAEHDLRLHARRSADRPPR